MISNYVKLSIFSKKKKKRKKEQTKFIILHIDMILKMTFPRQCRLSFELSRILRITADRDTVKNLGERRLSIYMRKNRRGEWHATGFIFTCEVVFVLRSVYCYEKDRRFEETINSQ